MLCQWDFVAVLDKQGKRQWRATDPRKRCLIECGILRWQLRREDDERAAATTARTDGADANQGRRKGITGLIQQFDDDSSQRGRVHAELHLHFSEWDTRKAAEQHDCESGPREADLESAGGEHFAL